MGANISRVMMVLGRSGSAASYGVDPRTTNSLPFE
jgi:hypothetical protein